VVDLLRVQTLLDRLGREVTALRRLAERDTDALLADEDVLAGVKYRFVVAIEACIDIGRHLVASEGWRAPRDYADVFTVLGENGVLLPDVMTTMQDTSRFRNLLVHEYVAVDDNRVIEILHSRVEDLQRFRRAIADVVRAAQQ
jgi:uncharacterized protein YutE (UPF0331/DUF86 family)